MRLLSTYPRSRPPMPARHAQLFEAEYQRNRDGVGAASASQFLERWMHRRVARRSGSPVLELGAGTLNHLAYERDLSAYDIVEPARHFLDGRPMLSRVRAVYASQREIPLGPTYERIVSIATLEHMDNLPAELAMAGLLLKPGGVFQAGIPSEGGALWWLAWRSTTGLAFWLRNRVDYGVLMRHEHLNTAPEIIALARHFFGDVRVTRFPAPFHHLSFYAYLEARRPQLDCCRAQLMR